MERFKKKTNNIENNLVDVNIKKINSWQYNGESQIPKSIENYFYNSIRFNCDKMSLLEESENLFINKVLMFKNTDGLYDKEEKIIVENYRVYPTCCIGQIFSIFKKNDKIQNLIGTGTIIGPNVVLTTGSNIYRKNLGTFIDI